MAELLHPLRDALRHVLPTSLVTDVGPSHKRAQPRFNKSRVVVCMLFDDGAPYGQLAAQINRRYASVHGYHFVARYNVSFFEGRAPAWQKIGLIMELFSSDHGLIFRLTMGSCSAHHGVVFGS